MFPFEPRRDSARRGPLRQPGPSPGRDLAPRQARDVGSHIDHDRIAVQYAEDNPRPQFS